jgi:hypothetical protein
MQLLTFDDLLKVVEDTEMNLRDILEMIIRKKESLIQARNFFSGLLSSSEPAIKEKGDTDVVSDNGLSQPETAEENSESAKKKAKKSNRRDWLKVIFRVLNGKELNLDEIFNNLHNQKVITFNDEKEKQDERARLKAALYKMRDGYVKQVSDEYNAKWTWIGAAIV